MPTTYSISNEGAGGIQLTFSVDTAANQDFTQTDLDGNLTAAVVTASNKAGMGTAGSRVAGKVIKVSEELQPGTAVPALCTVQVSGVVRLLYSGTAPTVGEKIEADGTGKVRRASTSTDVPAGGTKHRGLVLAVNATDTSCDVLLDA